MGELREVRNRESCRDRAAPPDHNINMIAEYNNLNIILLLSFSSVHFFHSIF